MMLNQKVYSAGGLRRFCPGSMFSGHADSCHGSSRPRRHDSLLQQALLDQQQVIWSHVWIMQQCWRRWMPILHQVLPAAMPPLTSQSRNVPPPVYNLMRFLDICDLCNLPSGFALVCKRVSLTDLLILCTLHIHLYILGRAEYCRGALTTPAYIVQWLMHDLQGCQANPELSRHARRFCSKDMAPCTW